MKACLCLLVPALLLSGCGEQDLVGVGAHRARPSRRPDEATMMPVCPSVYRVGGTHDPASSNYDPGVPDTALMHIPHAFTWRGRDPDGLCDPLMFRYRIDAAAFSDWAPDTTAAIGGLSSGAHDLFVQPGCPVMPGIENHFDFVVNFDPDSRIVEPSDESGTLTVADGDTLWVRVLAHDKEELEGAGGGVAQIRIGLDNDQQLFVPPEAAEWWWNSDADPSSGHHIESMNSPQGGNAPHVIRVSALDVDGRWEADGESFVFWYNFPPTVTVVYPAEGDTVAADFTVVLEGDDPDGEVVLFQYVLDPAYNAYRTTEFSEIHYLNEPGAHEFRVRARDASGCWSENWVVVHFCAE